MQAAGDAAKKGEAALDRARQAPGGRPAALAELVEEIAVPALDSALAAAERPGDNRAAAAYARQAAALCDAAARLLAQQPR
jgi:hypothetical protein